MEGTTHPYVKLSQTPLAQQTKVCGVPAKAASLVMGLFALVVVSGSHFVLGTLLLQARPEYEDPFDTTNVHSRVRFHSDTFMEDASKKHENTFTYMSLSVIGGMALFGGAITVITGIILLVAAILERPALFLPWFITMFFGIFLGRIAPLVTSIFNSNPYTKFFVVMACVDIVTIILVVICWGQLAGVQRNKRYANWVQNPRHNVKVGDGAGGVLLPPGSYPRQEV